LEKALQALVDLVEIEGIKPHLRSKIIGSSVCQKSGNVVFYRSLVNTGSG
jgi:hypothetical protein